MLLHRSCSEIIQAHTMRTEMQTLLYYFEKKRGKLHRQARSLQLQVLTVCIHTWTDDKRGEGVHRSVIAYYVKPLRAWCMLFKSALVDVGSGPTAHTCVLSVAIWHVFAPFEKYTSQMHCEFPSVCLYVCVCVCTTLSTCVLFSCGTQSQVLDMSFILMCHQSVRAGAGPEEKLP